jgi:threonine dehydratase
VASYSLELFRGVPDIDVLYVPIGLGSGICGAIAVRDALRLKTEIVGVTAEQAPAYALSFTAGHSTAATVGPTIADGMACRVPNPDALEIIRKGATRVVMVSDIEIRAAMRHLFTDTHNVAEGAGASAVAAALQECSRLQGRRIAVILSGANVDRQKFAEILAENDR